MKPMRIFISHSWHYPMIILGDSLHDRIEKLLLSKTDLDWRDMSVSTWTPIDGKYKRARIEAIVRKRIAASDVVIATADLESVDRTWLKRELMIARKHLKHPKPVLAVKSFRMRYWSKACTDHADAWAAWNVKSILNGLVTLRGLTPERRAELLSKGSPCTKCGRRQPRLELNRLGGVYCAQCGTIAYRLPGHTGSWRDRSRVWEGFPLSEHYCVNDWGRIKS